ncbi:hypothetical protein [Fretibacter rubidus]|uniref:hypothetical protein n=1 Tax=Fretibacter rubidus TaxID=570162 RepID=UPI00352BCA3D
MLGKYSKFVGYACIIMAAIAGFKLASAVLIPLLALVSTLFMVRSRMDISKTERRHAPPNRLIEGAFLFATQLMIIFIAYLLGYFAGSEGGAYFVDFMSGNRG